jgi:hypothetical protein
MTGGFGVFVLVHYRHDARPWNNLIPQEKKKKIRKREIPEKRESVLENADPNLRRGFAFAFQKQGAATPCSMFKKRASAVKVLSFIEI